MTLQDLKDYYNKGNSITDTIAKLSYGDYPVRPNKPTLKYNPNSDEVFKYAELLKEWEIDIKQYELRKLEFNKNRISVNSLIEEFIKDIANLDIVPEQYREKLFQKAYRDGHHNGYYEVYQILDNLINEIFA